MEEAGLVQTADQTELPLLLGFINTLIINRLSFSRDNTYCLEPRFRLEKYARKIFLPEYITAFHPPVKFLLNSPEFLIFH
jgi:hypothetical protein